MPFPDSITVAAQTWSKESCRDGFVYRVTGIQNPHITIHGVTESQLYDWQRYPTYHIIFGTGDIHEYYEAAPFPFKGGKKSTNSGTNRDDANRIAKDFWDAMKAV